MSQYSVTIHVKDDGTLKQLQSLQQRGINVNSSLQKAAANSPIAPKGGGGLAALGGQEGGGIFKKMQESGLLQVLKLTSIAAGVGALVAATIKSSGLLQGLFKLWEVMGILIFRPIGDFIALTLRPITLALFSMMLPFTKEMIKFSREYGTILGKALSDLFKGEPLANTLLGADLPNKADWDAFFSNLAMLGPNIASMVMSIPPKVNEVIIQPLFRLGADLAAGLATVPQTISKIFLDLGANIWNWLINIPQFLGGLFTNLGANIWNWLMNVPGMLWQLFLDLGNALGINFADIPGQLFDIFVDLGNNIISTLANVPNLIKSAILDFAKALFAGVGGEPPSGPVTKMAKGGMITEQIAGIGQSTGRRYLLGEEGPEMVVPTIGSGSQTFNTTSSKTTNNINKTSNINLTYYGTGAPAEASMLKTRIQAAVLADSVGI